MAKKRPTGSQVYELFQRLAPAQLKRFKKLSGWAAETEFFIKDRARLIPRGARESLARMVAEGKLHRRNATPRNKKRDDEIVRLKDKEGYEWPRVIKEIQKCWPDSSVRAIREAYRRRQLGKEYSSGNTEIISMGVEELYEDPVHFAEADPEYFKFIVGVLRGLL